MVNAWSLLWEEMNGTMDETYPIKENYDLLVDDPYPVVGSV